MSGESARAVRVRGLRYPYQHDYDEAEKRRVALLDDGEVAKLDALPRWESAVLRAGEEFFLYFENRWCGRFTPSRWATLAAAKPGDRVLVNHVHAGTWLLAVVEEVR